MKTVTEFSGTILRAAASAQQAFRAAQAKEQDEKPEEAAQPQPAAAESSEDQQGKEWRHLVPFIAGLPRFAMSGHCTTSKRSASGAPGQ